MLDANSPEFAARVDHLTKRLNQFINMTETEPAVLMSVLLRQLTVTIVTETMHMKKAEVMKNSLRSFRGGMNQAFDFFETIKAKEQTANDELIGHRDD